MLKETIISHDVLLSFENGRVIDTDFIDLVNKILNENLGKSLSGYIDSDHIREETDDEYNIRKMTEISHFQKSIAHYEQILKSQKDKLYLLEND